jgi:hypothetical protein
MMGQREIAMKLLSALAVGLMLAGPVSVSAEDVVPTKPKGRPVDDCLGDEVAIALAQALMATSGVTEDQDCLDALDEYKRSADQKAEQYLRQAEQDKRQAELRVRANNRLIDRDVLAACTELFAEQKTVAMTNSVCVMAFRQLGHPDLDK